MTAERAQFKEWLGKLKNAYSQVRPGSRIVFDSLEKIAYKVNEDGKDEEEVPRGTTGVNMNGMDFDEFNEELFTVLLDKTEGEVYRKVANQEYDTLRNGLKDAGMKAYVMIYVWFTETTGLQLSERRMRLMRPAAAKKEE